MGNLKWKNSLPLLYMTVPVFLWVLIFNYAPLWGWAIAFVDYIPGISVWHSKFAGLKYFFRLFRSTSDFLLVIRNTLALSFLNIVTMPIPVILAIMLTGLKNKKFGKIVQIISSFPHFISWVIVYSLFFSFLSIDDGLINQLFYRHLHWISQPTDILSDPRWSWALMTFATLWKTMGWTAIIYIAAIAGIDQELYQAAQADGANRLRQIWHITVPGILPTFMVMVLLAISNMLNSGFDQYWVFHNSLTNDVIEVIDTYTYRIGIEQSDFSYSTAAGIFKSFISVILLFLANDVHKRTVGHSII